MSHGQACSESTSTRCKCSCGGSLHGAVGAPAYRSLARSYRSSGSFAEAGRYAKELDRRTTTGKVANSAVNVLAEVIERSPSDVEELYQAVQGVVSDNAWELHMPPIPKGRRVGRSHWFCQALAETAEMLDQLADLPGTVEDSVCEHCREAGWGRLRSKAVGAAAGQIVRVTLAPSLAPVAALSMKVRIVALMFCPNSTKHPALEQACARQLFAALGLPAGAAA